MKIIRVILIINSLLISLASYSQERDSIPYNNTPKETDSLIVKEPSFEIAEPDSIVFNKKSPKKAAIFSAILPGLGQAYNEKYWKIPIVYSMMGGLVYWSYYNNKQYKRYLDAYVAVTDDDENTVDEFDGSVSRENLLYYKNKFRRNRDISLIMIGVSYLFNIIDASVDAHFSDYDVGEDLSIKIRPTIMGVTPQEIAPGIFFSIRFK